MLLKLCLPVPGHLGQCSFWLCRWVGLALPVDHLRARPVWGADSATGPRRHVRAPPRTRSPGRGPQTCCCPLARPGSARLGPGAPRAVPTPLASTGHGWFQLPPTWWAPNHTRTSCAVSSWTPARPCCLREDQAPRLLPGKHPPPSVSTRTTLGLQRASCSRNRYCHQRLSRRGQEPLNTQDRPGKTSRVGPRAWEGVWTLDQKGHPHPARVPGLSCRCLGPRGVSRGDW